MSEWITDRMPTKADGLMVYGPHGKLSYFTSIATGEAWKPIPKCDPYVKPKRYKVCSFITGFSVFDTVARLYVANNIPTREAAERIAAIYEEVMP